MAETIHVSMANYKAKQLREMKPEGVNFSEWVSEIIEIGLQKKNEERLIKTMATQKEALPLYLCSGNSALTPFMYRHPAFQAAMDCI